MFNKSVFIEALTEYKQNFNLTRWKDEKYKWEAIKVFQDNWDINSKNFAEMLKSALSKTDNLLASQNNFPAKMIQIYSQAYPEDVRAMFISLFDESKDIISRIAAFKDQSSAVNERHSNGKDQHYQNENSISTYLWLRYPDKYYIYKYSEVKNVASELKSSYDFKKGNYSDNLRNFYSFYDEICEEIKKDQELINLLKSNLTTECYPDPEFRTLTIDIGFFISRNISKKEASEWSYLDYSPDISVNDWVEMLNDPSIFKPSSLEIMKRMIDCGGQATCTQLSKKYGESKNFYNSGSSALARRVAEKLGLERVNSGDDNSRWWPILYVGKNADKDDIGSFIWKLRDNLSIALDNIDMSNVSLYANTTPSNGYWWLNANPKIWSFSNISIGEEVSYTLYNDNKNKRRIFQNFLDAKAGDLIIGYESNPVKKIVAIGKVCKEQDGKEIWFSKIESLSNPIDYLSLKNCKELDEMEYFSNPQGSLFKLTKDEFDFIIDMIRDENPVIQEKKASIYSKNEFLKEVFMTENRYNILLSVLQNKKNIILQGAPGVGKTYTAKRLAYSIMGEKNDDRVEFVQFHQNYSYEDFMMGYKPVENGFELKNGIFYRFCQKASNQPDKDFFFIIDEINRGNLSKIFGELLMLIEKDYRGTKATLAYNGLSFAVPSNVYLIGMMNTADRSLAMIDYALRRRFSFFEIEPGFDSDGFITYKNSLNSEIFNDLIIKIQELNREITLDHSLGKGFCIGHSYFIADNPCTDIWMKSIIDFDILPLLREYWFDDTSKLQRWENILLGILQ